jgi:heterodisulfide reductase subunit A-like polyferredoxin
MISRSIIGSPATAAVGTRKAFPISNGITMKEIREPSRHTPVIAETDVLVVGSGPGGLAAAVSSARAGVPTMLVERYGCLVAVT